MRDSIGRPIISLVRDGIISSYYIGPDAHGLILRDEYGEYIIVGGEKRYWKGNICTPSQQQVLQLNLRNWGLVVEKPDAICRGLHHLIISTLKTYGLKIITDKNVYFDKEMVYKMYPYFFEENWENHLVDYLTSSHSRLLLVRDPNGVPIEKLLNIRKEIRGLRIDSDHSVINIIHAPDNFSETINEACLFFQQEELIEILTKK